MHRRCGADALHTLSALVALLLVALGISGAEALPPMRSVGTALLEAEPVQLQEAEALREEARSMFQATFDGYMAHAFPRDELAPLSCTGRDTLGGYSLTLIDSLDSLAVVSANASAFADAVALVESNLSFDVNSTVSVFETNIRILGSLLSAHLLASDSRTGFSIPWYSNSLLELAHDLGKRLLPAFDTPTGIPFGSINLKHGVSPHETRITSTACGGTLALEFGTLSRLTGDATFERVAVRSLHAIWSRRSKLDLVGAHIDVFTGEWTHVDAGVGTSVDSFYEYLLKAFVLLGDTEYLHMFERAYNAAEKHLKRDGWYVEVNMNSGGVVWPVFNSLQAFWPGLQVLYGDFSNAAATHEAFFSVWRQYGFTPEGYNLMYARAQNGQEQYPLRPELAESTYLLYRTTWDPVYQAVGREMMASLRRTRTECGHAMVADVTTHRLHDSMESFFLSETLKYLFLLFDSGTEMNNLIDSGPFTYVFTTEGHVLPIIPQLSNLAGSVSEGSERVDQNATGGMRPLPAHVHPSLLLGKARYQLQPGGWSADINGNSGSTSEGTAPSSDGDGMARRGKDSSSGKTNLPAKSSLQDDSDRTAFVIGTRPAVKPYLEAQAMSRERDYMLPKEHGGRQRETDSKCSLPKRVLDSRRRQKVAPLQKTMERSTASDFREDDSDTVGRCSVRSAVGRFARVRMRPQELQEHLHELIGELAGIQGQQPMILQ